VKNPGTRRNTGLLHPAACLGRIFFYLALSLSLQETALADSISGYLDYTYTQQDIQTKEASGLESDQETETFRQQYSLTLDKTIYPNLKLLASGIFEKSKTTSTFSSSIFAEQETTVTTTILRPFIDLTLRTPLYIAGIGYNRRERKDETSNAPSITNVNEEYNAVLGWKPDGFPSVNLRLSRTNFYDKDRAFRDATEDYVTLLSEFEPASYLRLRYRGTYDNIDDKLNELETRTVNHTGSAWFTEKFFRGKVLLNTSYEISRRTTETTAGGTGDVALQEFPFAGLYALDDTPVDGELDPAPALIDGNVAAGAGISIGLPGILGDTRPRNMGLFFVNETEINTLYVWVDRELPIGISSSYSWDIYTSTDNLIWTFRQTISSAPFSSFQNRFEINFSTLTERYIKIVVNPLTPGAAASEPSFLDPDKISVTELQAFIRMPAEDIKGEFTTTTHHYNLDIRTRLLDNPDLYYDLTYFYYRTESRSVTTTSTLSNSLSASYRFSRVFTGNARVAREDSKEERGDITAYITKASVTAAPFRTLSHTLTYSGRYESVPEGNTSRSSFFLYNTAELYRGINVYLSGGLDFTELETGRNQDSTLVTAGANIVPHRTLALNISYTSRDTDESGGGRPDSSTLSRTTDLTVSYQPFRSLYLFTTLTWLTETDRKDTLKNYGVTWSPFPDGALQFSFAYDENLRTQDDAKETLIRPSLRWKLGRSSYLDFSYLVLKSDSVTEEVDTKIFSTNLRIYF